MEEVENLTFKCEFCTREFAKERTLINHNCEKKRRWFAKDEHSSVIAFMAWSRFYEMNSSFGRSADYKNSFRNFINSKEYIAFIKFGKYVTELNPIEPKKFIDYVLKSNIPINKWTHDFVYTQYVHELIRKETPESALERNILLMKDWSQTNSEPWYDFFRKVNTNQAVLWIKSGRISPWLLYNAESATEFFQRCNPEQIGMIKSTAPPGPWKIKFGKNKDTTAFIKKTLKESGL